MKTLICILGLAIGSASFAADSVDPARAHLKGYETGRTRIKWDAFIYPFLIVEQSVKSERSKEELVNRIRNHLLQFKLPFKGHYEKKGKASKALSPATLPLPEEIFTGNNLSQLKECNPKFCKMKLNTGLEKTVMAKAPEGQKVATYHRLVTDRVKWYLEKRQLRGYEGRANNVPIIGKMFKLLSFAGREYPQCSRFMGSEFWKNQKSACRPLTSFLTQEIVILRVNRVHPILRWAEVFEFKENGRHFFVQIDIYTNHYYNVSARVFEVLSFTPEEDKKSRKKDKDKKPPKPVNVVVLTDFFEIDQITDSSIIRALYKGRTVTATHFLQKETLNSVR